MAVTLYTWYKGEDTMHTHKHTRQTEVQHYDTGKGAYSDVVNIFDGEDIMVSLRGRVVHDIIRAVLKGSDKRLLKSIRDHIDLLITGELQ